MKKYLSCIILIALCVVCVTIFYVNANEIEEPAINSSVTLSSVQTGGNVDDTPPKISIEKSGTFHSEYLSSVNLRIEWSLYKLENEPTLYVSAELYLDTPEQITQGTVGYISVGGDKREFTTQTMIGTCNLLTTYSTALTVKEGDVLYFNAYAAVPSTTASGEALSDVSAHGAVTVREEDIPSSHTLGLSLISKYPELPSGEEITSLCMVLNYLKYKVDKSELCDLYLDKGPAHYTDIFVANAGNPRDTYNSYGCMPPVIVNAANKFVSANGGNHYAKDISGYSVDELYYQVAKGNPIIVWACEDFDSTPSISRTLIIDGKRVYLKSNVNTLVLIGYDSEKNTVTLANPSGNVFDLDMDVFERSYLLTGSYAVLVN